MVSPSKKKNNNNNNNDRAGSWKCSRIGASIIIIIIITIVINIPISLREQCKHGSHRGPRSLFSLNFPGRKKKKQNFQQTFLNVKWGMRPSFTPLPLDLDFPLQFEIVFAPSSPFVGGYLRSLVSQYDGRIWLCTLPRVW